MKGLIGVALLVLASSSLFAEQEIDLTPYANANIQAKLYPTFPTGKIIPPNNDFNEPFKIPASGNNFVDIEQDVSPLTIPIGVAGVRRVYTLIQEYAPWQGYTVGRVEFIGSEGAHQSFNLVAGTDVRDFFENNLARTINNTSTQNAYEFIGQGGAYTNNTSTGPRGFYHFDEQEFVLDPSFATQTLESIKITRLATIGAPILLGLTVETSPERKVRIFSFARLYYGGLVVGLLVLVGVFIILRVRR